LGTGGATNNAAKALYQITKTWVATTVSWNNQPAFNSTALAQNSNTAVQKWEDYDITSAIKNIIENNAADYGFLLKFPSENQYKGARIYSSEAQNATLRPKLSITYSPLTTGLITTQPLNNKQITIKYSCKALFITNPYRECYTINISDLRGRKLVSFKTTAGKERYEMPATFSPGIHCISLVNSKGAITEMITFIK
jgi:hypothetical protein